jgi:hypothetical protein
VQAGLGAPRRHRPPQCTTLAHTLAHALQLHNEWVDQKLARDVKKKNDGEATRR